MRTFTHRVEALIAKGKLEDAGITCFLDGEPAVIDLQWLNASGSKGYALKVWESDFKEALKLLNESD